MPFPSQRELELPLLKVLASLGGRAKPKDVYEPVAAFFPDLTIEDRQEVMESTGAVKWQNDVQWVRQRLVERGEIDGSVRGVWTITEKGRTRLDGAGSEHAGIATPSREAGPCLVEPLDQRSPGELIEIANRQLRSALSTELLELVQSCSPQFFERLVVDLLLKMGYGGTRKEAGRAVGHSGDGGIDGIINEDRLGLDTIYLQAKRWEGVVGRPEIHKFVGALHSQRARKGVFITTSRFTREAVECVATSDPKIVLIDGEELARLMIDYGVGVAPVASYDIKRVDLDYFAGEDR